MRVAFADCEVSSTKAISVTLAVFEIAKSAEYLLQRLIFFEHYCIIGGLNIPSAGGK